MSRFDPPKLPWWQRVIAWALCILGIPAIIVGVFLIDTFRWGPGCP